MGVDYDDLTNGEQNAPSIFSSAGLSAGAFLKSPYDSHPGGSNSSAPDIQVCAERESQSAPHVSLQVPKAFFFEWRPGVHGKKGFSLCRLLQGFAVARFR